MDKKDRLAALIEHYENGNKSKFAKLLGITPQGLSTWISRNTYDIEVIYAKCENVSAEWLITGEGDMIRPTKKGTDPTVRDCSSDCLSGVQNTQKSCSNGVQSAIDPIVGQLLNRLSAQAEEIGRLKREVEEAEERATAAMKRAETS